MRTIQVHEMVDKKSSSLKASELLEEGLYPVFGAQGIVGYLNTFQTDKKSIAIIKDGAGVGRVQIVPENSSVIGTMQLLIPKDGFSVEYLYFLFNYLNLGKTFTGSTIPHIYFRDYGRTIVKYHDVNSQLNIVKKLSIITESIAKAKKRTVLFEELLQSRFLEMFENKEPNKSFGDCVVKMTKGPFGSAVKKDLYVPESEDAYKVYIQVNCIQKDETLGDYYISKEYFESKMKSFEIQGNDYLITCDGTLGKYLRLSNNPRKGIISASLLRIKLNENMILPKYFESLWDYQLLDILKGQVRNGCLTHLPSAKVIGDEKIFLPPMPVQKEFEHFSTCVEKSKNSIKKRIVLLTELLNKKMDEYFGEEK